jgi:glutamate/tyrosine decarboxylase-like PLP-dependent enzyme
MSATVQLHFLPKRLLTKSEAAHHCGRSVRRFDVECRVAPVKFPNGDLRYDVRDLDQWIDSMKAGKSSDADEIIGRLK